MTRSDRGGLPPGRVHAASAAWVFLPAAAPRVETDDYLLVRYPDWLERPVQLAWLRSERDLDAVVAEAVGHARTWVDAATPATAEVACWVRLDAPAGTEEAFVRAGGELDETVAVLALDLADFDAAVLAVPDDVELRWSSDFEVMVAAGQLGAEVFGGGSPDRAELAALHPAEVAKHASGGGGAIVAFLDGRPVGTGGVTVAGRDARLWGGAVLPEARSRGVYRALLAERLAYARAHGADLALVKGRVETSAPILKRAGFAAYGVERSWLIPLQI